jgi:hypothetical protein
LGGGAAVELLRRREQRIGEDDVDVDLLAGESTLGPVLLGDGVLLIVHRVDGGRVLMRFV